MNCKLLKLELLWSQVRCTSYVRNLLLDPNKQVLEFLAGDYMDTAVSVAKQCGIVLPEDRLVCVEPAPGVKDVEYRTVASRKQRDINHYNGCITSTVADLWNDSETLQPVFAMTGESLRRIRNQCRTVDSLMSRNKAGVTELDKVVCDDYRILYVIDSCCCPCAGTCSWGGLCSYGT